MFVIVHNNFVIFGPRPWNKLAFEEILREECEVEYTLPGRKDNLDPININDNTRILTIANLPDPEGFNPKIHRLDGPYWNFKEDVAEMYFTKSDLPVDMVRDQLKAKVADNRYKKEVAGFKMTVQGHEVTIDTARETRDIFLQTHLFMGNTETITWKFPEKWLDVSKTNLEQIITAGKAHIQSCFNWEKAKASELDNAKTLTDLIAVDLEV